MNPPAGRNTGDNPLQRICARGQSVWLKGMRRRLASSGRLAELISGAALRGVATDLVALAGAVERGGEYGEPLQRAAEQEAWADLPAALLAEDAALVAAALQPLYEESGGSEGLVSVPVDVSAAQDAEAMARAARRLLAATRSPNLVPSLPPTDAGFAVFETLVADGVHALLGPVHTTGSVLRAAEAFVRGSTGAPASAVRTAVVSFGVAPLGNLIDQLLQRRIRTAQHDVSGVESLLGSAATAAAKVAWRRQRDLLAASSHEPSRLRIAWTDLRPADPRQPREHFVEQLVGPDTITVLDVAELGTLMQRGDIDATLGQRVDEAEEVLAELADLGLDVEEVGAALEAKAVRRLHEERAGFEERVAAVVAAFAAAPAAAARRAQRGTPWAAAAVEIDDALAPTRRLADSRAVARLWDKDAALWESDADAMELVRNRLGWLDAGLGDAVELEPMLGFAAELEAGEIESVVLLGMGGSSLTAEVCRELFGTRRLRVLDSTVPGRIKEVAGDLDPARTAVLVASKSGTTIEVRALCDWFYALATPILDRPGERFIAVTDPGTPLEQLAHERGFDRLWLAPADVGGRFAALTVFGTLPMALMGIDVPALRASAQRMAAACAPEVAPEANPAGRLAAALYEAWRAGRDKITIVPAPVLGAFAPWVEQLVAESTGKLGRGLVPVIDEPPVAAAGYAEDRLFVSLALRPEPDADHQRRLDELSAAGQPLLRFELEDRHDLGGELFRWEAAVALLGALMQVNPFDQPDVQASKDRTAALLAADRAGTPMSDRQPLAAATDWAVFADIERDAQLGARQRGDGLASWLSAHLGRAAAPEYVGIQAFLSPEPEVREALQALRLLLLERCGVATTLGWGPAFLHSTGQLHKGGPANGLYLQVTADDEQDIEVPGAGYTFGRLLRAQSLGDLAALQSCGRRVMRVHLRAASAGCRTLLEAARAALKR